MTPWICLLGYAYFDMPTRNSDMYFHRLVPENVLPRRLLDTPTVHSLRSSRLQTTVLIVHRRSAQPRRSQCFLPLVFATSTSSEKQLSLHARQNPSHNLSLSIHILSLDTLSMLPAALYPTPQHFVPSPSANLPSRLCCCLIVRFLQFLESDGPFDDRRSVDGDH